MEYHLKDYYAMRRLNWVVFLALICSGLGCQPAIPAVQGASGMGDPYYAELGNGGYDVEYYALTLDVDPATNTLMGTTQIVATATQSLKSFNLDLHALTVDRVQVDSLIAEFTRQADELTITLNKPLLEGRSFTTLVTYHGVPELLSFEAFPVPMGWSHADDGSINVWGEPAAASTWFPSNNHLRDKANYRFEITVPKPWVVAASGVLQETREQGDKTLFVFEMHQPMATYLASVNIDHYEQVMQAGTVPIQNYFPPDYPIEYRQAFDVLPAALEFFSQQIGPYPFESYGVVIASRSSPCNIADTALEVQSLSVHCPSASMASERVIVHELAHQWFGDSVSLKNWQDVWLKEGFATYAEWMWRVKNDPAELRRVAREEKQAFSDSPASVAEPPANALYTRESYTGAALVLQALREQIGDDVFMQLLKTYASHFQYGNASTQDFMALAEEVSGQDLDAFFEAWLFGAYLPDLPAQN